MSRPFFHSPDRLADLSAAAESWLRTPFHPRARIKGAGVDCVQLAAAIYLELGAIPDVPFPHYTMDGGTHLTESLVISYVEGLGCFQRIEPRWGKPPSSQVKQCKSCGPAAGPLPRFTVGEFFAGDFLGFQIGKVVHHCGVFLGGSRFIHTFKPYAVHYGNLLDPTWLKRLVTVHRPIERAGHDARSAV
jgi:cell wall-associated NlpC family hydrolase